MKPIECFRPILAAATLYGAAAAADPVEIHVLSATVRDQSIAQAEVLLQKNGLSTAHGYTESDGGFHGQSQFSADDPAATLIIRKAGYSTLVAKCPCNRLSYAISPVMTQLDGMRIVLNWGGQPSDLDAHLVYGGNHVYWNQKEGDEATLDVDHRDGYGPETVTLLDRHPGQRYIYAVHDYSDRERAGSQAMELARPQVRVYIGQTLVRSYEIDPRQHGNLWTVFAIDENGELRDLDSYSDVIHPESVAQELAPELKGPLATAARNVSERDRARATQFNRDGEAAYRRQDYGNAIGAFQQAIDLYPDYGQAYSNLGLAFAKAGDSAEALWADRKAIVLADGADAARVRASSYYNIARIYEAGGEWARALDSYRAAENQKHNDVYLAAMTRMQQKVR